MSKSIENVDVAEFDQIHAETIDELRAAEVFAAFWLVPVNPREGVFNMKHTIAIPDNIPRSKFIAQVMMHVVEAYEAALADEDEVLEI